MEKNMPTFPALILAGDDPDAAAASLARAEGVAARARIEVGGRPMALWVIEAAQCCPRISDVTVMGGDVSLDSGTADNLGALIYLPSAPRLADNVMAGLHLLCARAVPASHALILTGDSPMLTHEMITWFVDACAPWDLDLYYGIVERSLVEEHYALSGRTWLRTREGSFCGGNIFLVRPEAVLRIEPLLRTMISRCASNLDQTRMLGPVWSIQLALGRVRVDEVVAMVGQIAGIRGRAIVLPFADAAMDVDNAHELAMVRNAMARRRRRERGSENQ